MAEKVVIIGSGPAGLAAAAQLNNAAAVHALRNAFITLELMNSPF